MSETNPPVNPTVKPVEVERKIVSSASISKIEAHFKQLEVLAMEEGHGKAGHNPHIWLKVNLFPWKKKIETALHGTDEDAKAGLKPLYEDEVSQCLALKFSPGDIKVIIPKLADRFASKDANFENIKGQVKP